MRPAIYRYEVPVDDAWHEIPLSGSVVSVEARAVDVIEFWAYHLPDAPQTSAKFCVVGTGHPIPVAPGVVEREPLDQEWALSSRCVGSAVVGPFAWHLMQAAE